MMERPSKTYQDQWVKGQLAVKGTRECASRYEIIKSFCARYDRRPFSVCDIGANMCYFGLRLTEDFPRCSVVAFEYDNFPRRAAHVKTNGANRLMLINHKLSSQDLLTLTTCCRFDLVLVLNVLHHVGDEFDTWLLELRKLARHIIAEFATTDSRSRRQGQNYSIPYDARVLGYCQSHIKREVERPMVLIPGSVQ
jgi:2-polyprenyl-3-methyl-5-hydroxy-6-metoxy-1,4-benzoquinol methylase